MRLRIQETALVFLRSQLRQGGAKFQWVAMRLRIQEIALVSLRPQLRQGGAKFQ
jgi:hypothetical protein